MICEVSIMRCFEQWGGFVKQYIRNENYDVKQNFYGLKWNYMAIIYS